LPIHTLEKVFVKTLVQKLIKDGKFHNWVTQEAQVVLKM
jgi:hypothetical protein